VLLNADGEAVVCDFGSAGAARCTVNTKADANRWRTCAERLHARVCVCVYVCVCVCV
jgi:hypothetical protein